MSTTPARYCAQCGKRLKYAQRQFCSNSCSSTAKGMGKQGPNARRWKGGRMVTSAGYVLIWNPDAPANSGALHYRPEHRVVAEQMLGRPLTTYEHVHHLNGDKADNRPENLIVLGRQEHALRYHAGSPAPEGRWARWYDACIDCGSTERRHEGGGRCHRCKHRWKVAQTA